MADRVGERFGNYELLQLLGKGGFAEVYLGRHVHLQSSGAVKVLHAQLVTREQEEFLQEARVIASLEHPSIIRVLDCGIEREIPFLIMNYAPNGTLRQRYAKGACLALSEIVGYVTQIASALQYAHERKLIHRDVKPENMLIGSRGEVLLSDFGIALVSASSSSQSTKAAAGTVAYMAPEQIMGKPRIASDQYALGVVVYEWLCGGRPFHGSFAELCAQHLYAPPPSLSANGVQIASAVEAVVMRALAKDSQQRFASVLDFAQELEQACQSVQLPAEPVEIDGNAATSIASGNLSTVVKAAQEEEYIVTAIAEGNLPTVVKAISELVSATHTTEPREAASSREGGDTIRREMLVARSVQAPSAEPQFASFSREMHQTGQVIASWVPPQPELFLAVNRQENPPGVLNAAESQVPSAIPNVPGKAQKLPSMHWLMIAVILVLVIAIIAASSVWLFQSAHGSGPNTRNIVQRPTSLATSIAHQRQGSSPTLTGKISPTGVSKPTAISRATTTGNQILNSTPTSVSSPVPTAIPTSVPTATPVPTAPPTPSPTPVLPILNVSPVSMVNDFANCTMDTHGGGASNAFCTMTLTNTAQASGSLQWSASINPPDYTLSTSSGSIAAGQSATFTLYGSNPRCPGSETLTITGPANTVQVPIACADISVTPDQSIFSLASCTHNINWTCVVTVTANSANPINATWGVFGQNYVNETFSPASGTLAPGASVQVMATIPGSDCPGNDTLFFQETPIAGPNFDSNPATYLHWSC